MTIGYDTQNNCLTSVKTHKDTSFKEMFKICIDHLIQNKDVKKYETILLNVADNLDQQ